MKEIRAFCRREGITMFAALLATLSAVLGAYASEDDIVVATYLANRSQPELDGLLGPRTNLVLLRMNVSPGSTFRELVRRARLVLQEAQSHQHIPHHALAQVFAREGLTMPEPRVIIMHTAYEGLNLGFDGLNTDRILPPQDRMMPWGMTFQNGETQHELRNVLHFSTDLYEPSAAHQMQDDFCRLLINGTTKPDLPLDELCIRSRPQRETIVQQPERVASTPDTLP
jgi:non-ribosomal peptide synthetase component F